MALVDPLCLVTDPGAHADIVLDHEASQFLAVDQEDTLWAPRHAVSRSAGEASGGDEHTLTHSERGASLPPASALSAGSLRL